MQTTNVIPPPQLHRINICDFTNRWAENFHTDKKCEILYIFRGSTELRYKDGRHFSAQRGDVLIIPSNTSHKDVFEPRHGLKVLIVSFLWDGMEDVLNTINNKHINDIDFNTKSEIWRLFENIRSDIRNQKLAKCTQTTYALCQTRLFNILLLYKRELYDNVKAKPSEETQNQILVKDACSYIERNYASVVSLKKLAEDLKISKSHLSHLFREECGISPRCYLENVRLSRAKELLANGDMRISEIAEAVGYDNGNYFAQVFRRKFNCSPKKFNK